MELSISQKAAVEHYKGPAMILAGPGSGKTFTITHRLMYLTKEKGVLPENILVITFTKKAAVQMKDRYLKLIGESTSQITFGTFHAVFFMILKSYCNYKAEDIVTVGQQRDIVKMFLRSKSVVVHNESVMTDDILSEIAKVKSMGGIGEGYTASSCETSLFKEIYAEYVHQMRDWHKVDFEDMMIKTLELMVKDKGVLEKWQDRYEYILIDEFQDASPVQFEVMKLLADRHKNIFVVGDDDQSIYGFRGATPGVMREFGEYYKGLAVYHLNVNYRCTSNIVNAATHIIDMNINRFPKDLKAFNKAGEEVVIAGYGSLDTACLEVAYMIADDIKGRSGSTAVLTRTHNGAKNLVMALSKIGVKVSGAGKSESIYSHWIADDICAYIRIAIGVGHRSDYLRVINRPKRLIGRTFFTDEYVDRKRCLEHMLSLHNKDVYRCFKEFCDDCDYVRHSAPYMGLLYIRKKMGYDKYLEEYALTHGGNVKELYGIIGQLQESLRSVGSYEKWLDMVHIQTGMEKNGLVKESTDDERVIIATVHSAKGLEFDNVYIWDVSEGIMPYSKATSEQELEEERRLFYVAMTRAKNRLVICYGKERYSKYVQPSRYVRELHKWHNCAVRYYSSSSSSS